MRKGDGAVILGGDFQALGLVRSLAEQNIPVFIVEYEKSICRYSKYVLRREWNPELFNEDVFVSYLIDLGQRENLYGWVIFPNNDELVKLLSKYRKELNKIFVISVPPWESVQKFYYKHLANEAASSTGIPTPKLYFGKSLEDYVEQELEFPIVLKPAYKEKYFPIVKKKGVQVDTLQDFIVGFKEMSHYLDPGEIVVQEMILGGPKNLFSYATVFDGGKIIAGMAARRLRQHPMDFGQATTFAVSVNEPDLADLTVRILSALNYSGIAEVEFMKDERDGSFKFIEINGRVWGWHTLAKAAGLNLPYILYQHLRGEAVEAMPAEDNVKWIRLITDIPIVLNELIRRRMTISEYLSSFKGKKEFAVMSLKDPLPFIVEYAFIPYLWRKRGF
jgi:predicted ATP-grasp superfamily ATP-dependent carboligase